MNLSGFLIFIPLLPLIGFLILGLGQHRVSRSGAGLIASSFAFLAFCLSLLMFSDQVGQYQDMVADAQLTQAGMVPPETTPIANDWGSWLHFAGETDKSKLRYGLKPSLDVNFGLVVDRLTSLMLLIVTGIGTLIHIYSIGYMSHDKSPSRFFAYLNLFLAMMLTLVMADNLVLMFVGWEGVGLCSYLLIGFWYEDPEKAKAGRKAFVVNRIGDVGFLLGICIFLFAGVGLKFGPDLKLDEQPGHLRNLPVWVNEFYVPALQTSPQEALAEAQAGGEHAPTIAEAQALGLRNLMIVGLLCLFVGAIGKSAQIPLFVWLPDAMAGPTPVSALIHAATMVTAGVYMIIRLEPLFGAEWAEPVRIVIATVGIATALVAGATAITQTDIKKVLAYSTVSQLGYMVLALGVGAFDAAFFHLLTHAFFKALLFLGAGSVIHGMSDEQDMRKMGGLRLKMKITYWTMLIGAAGLAGIPLLCGFFSKDEILYRSLHAGLTGNSLYLIYYFVGVLTAAMTAFYSFRLIALTFHGESRANADVQAHVHESPTTMTAPLVVLAIGTVIIGLWNLPANVNHLFDHHDTGGEYWSKGVVSRFLQTDETVRVQLQPSATAVEHTAAVPAAGADHPTAAATNAPKHAAAGKHELANEAAYEWGGMIGSGLLALIMAVIGLRMYANGTATGERLAAIPAVKPFYKLSAGKFFFDEVFDNLVVSIKVISFLAWLIVDYIVIDSLIVDGLGTLAQAIGENFRRIQTGVINSYLLLMVVGAIGILCYFALQVWIQA